MSGEENRVKLTESSPQNPMEFWMKSWEEWKDVGLSYGIYAKSWEMFFLPNSDQLAKFGEEWFKPWNLLEIIWPLNLKEMSQKPLNLVTFDSFRNTDDFWNNSWFNLGNQFLKAYFQMIQSFSEQFQNMWKPLKY